MNDTSSGRGIGFWLAVVVGWGFILLGTIDYIAKRGASDAIKVATWVVGGNIAHDALLVPVVLLVGAVLTRCVPEPLRTPLRAGLVASACVVLVAVPVLGGYGRKAANPSLLPLDYGSAVLTALAIVWTLAVVWLALRFVRRMPAR
jgi:hypothetical protein